MSDAVISRAGGWEGGFYSDFHHGGSESWGHGTRNDNRKFGHSCVGDLYI